MPRARGPQDELHPAIAHFLAEGCPAYRPDVPAEDALEWFRLLHPRHRHDLSPLQELWATHRAALERRARAPWVVRVLAGRAPPRPIECAIHRRQRRAALRVALAELARAEAEQLEQAREVETRGVTRNAVAAIRQHFAERRLWLEREATTTEQA
jgi:hypothetical protein